MTPLRRATRWREAPIRAASEKDDDLYATKKRIEIGEIVPVLQDHLASSTYPAGRARLREALVVAEYIASRKSGGTDAEWEQLVHDIAVANRTIKSGA